MKLKEVGNFQLSQLGQITLPATADGSVRFREAACCAYLRRDFHDLWVSTKSPVAREALDRIGALYDIESRIAGQNADTRLAARQAHSKPKVEAFRAWAAQQVARIPAKGDLANAFRYALTRWPSFCLFLDDGRVAIDNNAAERALRPIGIGRHNWPFAGSDTGAETLARAMTIIETAKMNDLDPGLPHRRHRPHQRPQDQPYRRFAAVELDATGNTPKRTASHAGAHSDNHFARNGGLMPTVGRVCTLGYVATLLGEDLEMPEAIVSNDDNLTYGSIVSVSTGPDESITSLTEDGVDEQSLMVTCARRSPDE
jgi:hypothetical protein